MTSTSVPTVDRPAGANHPCPRLGPAPWRREWPGADWPGGARSAGLRLAVLRGHRPALKASKFEPRKKAAACPGKGWCDGARNFGGSDAVQTQVPLRMGPMGRDPSAAGPVCCGAAGSPWSLLSNGGKAVAALSRLIFPTTPLSAPHEIHCTPARAAPGAGRATATSLRCAVGRTRFARAGGVHSPRAGGCDPGFLPCLYGLGTSRLLCT